MPSILRSRIALFSLMGVFLIPIGMSSLRGLTHVLTCSESVRTPFTLVIPERGAPEAVTSTAFGRNEDALCGGLSLELGARVVDGDHVAMVVPITNDTPYVWRGTVTLALDETSIPVDIGQIDGGATVTDTVPFELDQGSHELSGSLLIGP